MVRRYSGTATQRLSTSQQRHGECPKKARQDSYNHTKVVTSGSQYSILQYSTHSEVLLTTLTFEF